MDEPKKPITLIDWIGLALFTSIVLFGIYFCALIGGPVN